MTAEVFLLRHGETRWNVARCFQGQHDSPLTARGREQAARLGRTLTRALAGRPPVPLHVSPLGRTRDTATIVRQGGPALSPATIEPRLQEVSTGAWEGLTRTEIETGWPGMLDGASHYDLYFRAPDGESHEVALRRVRAWMDELHGPVIAGLHGLLGRLVRGAWLGLSADGRHWMRRFATGRVWRASGRGGAAVVQSVGIGENDVIIRELAPTDSIAELTALLHAAYALLGGMGFNYTAVDQSEDVTRKRIARGLCLVASDGGALVGTIMFHPPGRSAGCPCYERADVATIGQFGVLPGRQSTGTGTRLLRHAEQLAAAAGAAELALDTSEGADHLIAWYERERFRFVEHARWEGKTYRSVIMSKLVHPTGGA